MRTGAIEHLNQRVGKLCKFPHVKCRTADSELASLENMFLGQGVLWQQVWRCLDSINQQSLPLANGKQSGGTLQEYTAHLKHTLSNLQPDRAGDLPSTHTRPSTKKRKTGKDVLPQERDEVFWMRDGRLHLPEDLVDSLVDIYFARIQPWIPILHVVRFQENMKIPHERKKMNGIFHAIASLCARFSDDPRLADYEVRSRLVKECRQAVILDSMESFSVESLQSLIICAFDTVYLSKFLYLNTSC